MGELAEKTGLENMVKIRVIIPAVNDYIRDGNGDPLEFGSIKELLKFLAEKNCTIMDCLRFDYDIGDG